MIEKELKDTFRKTLNLVFKENNLDDWDDSTSSLTSKTMHLTNQPIIEFSIDVAIVGKDKNGQWYRLIHNKKSIPNNYFWNKAPNSKNYNLKVKAIKDNKNWSLVRNEYLKLKNYYLTHNDYDHPSFICYIEAVNNIYNHLQQR